MVRLSFGRRSVREAGGAGVAWDRYSWRERGVAVCLGRGVGRHPLQSRRMLLQGLLLQGLLHL